MRALREQIGPADERHVWESFLLDAIRQAPLPDFLLYGEPYPALNAIVLTPSEHQQLISLTECFAGIFHKATLALAHDTAALERMGFPWIASELLQHESGDRLPLLGRFDFLLDQTGKWQLLEYNADTPSGARETVRVEPLIVQHLQPFLSHIPRGTAHHLATLLCQEFLSALQGNDRSSTAQSLPSSAATDPSSFLPLPDRRSSAVIGGSFLRPPSSITLGIITDTGYSEDLAQTVFAACLLRPALEPSGIRVLFGDVDNLSFSRGRLCLFDMALDALYRYFPFEAMLGLEAFADLFHAVTIGKLNLLNGLHGLLAQNKGLLAWLWQHRDDASLFTAKERTTIDEHLPPTWWISDVPLEADLSNQVLKQVFGREGEEVYFGDTLSPDDLRRCRAWGSYIVQARVQSDPVPAVIHSSLGPHVATLWPVLGSYTLHGRWGGYYTRLGSRITTAHAKYIATLYE